MIKKNKSVVKILLLVLLLIFTMIGSVLIKQIPNQNKNIEKIPTTSKKIKNVIYMIGDGMGENHIIAAELYKGKKLNIQKIKNKSYVVTDSLSGLTDSAAAATALATGYKTNNGVIGKDIYGNNIENLIEYTNRMGMKTGIVCTQILNHATPAGFSVHNDNRNNYDEISLSQIKSCVDLMLGGGRIYFRKYQTEMIENNFNWVNNLYELRTVDKSNKVIGTFGENSISLEIQRVSLADLTKEAISRLDNSNGFFLMIEGSDIDTYSHQGNLSKTINEMIDFDNAVKVAKEYVDKNKDTLLIITADHETGGLNLDGITTSNELNDSLFTSNGAHTSNNVLIYAYGMGAKDLTRYNIIDNTYICKFVRKGIMNNYEN